MKILIQQLVFISLNYETVFNSKVKKVEKLFNPKSEGLPDVVQV